MKEIWERIENWLKENYHDGLKELNTGASIELIKQTEQQLGIEFPQDIRDFYKTHNGATSGFPILYGFDLLSMDEIYDQWKVWKELLDSGEFEGITCTPHKGVSDNWYHEKWIPLTYNGCGDHHCLDFAPTEDGKAGQIIEMWHDDDFRPIVANNFKEWLENYLNELETGNYVYSEDYGGIVNIDDI